MGAVKNAFHDEICLNGMSADERAEADFYAAVEEVGCPYKLGDVRQSAWLDGFVAALDWAMKSIAQPHPVSGEEE